MKNRDIKAKMRSYGIEWIDVARSLHMSLKDFTRRLNSKTVSPIFRRNLLDAIERINRRPEDYYDE